MRSFPPITAAFAAIVLVTYGEAQSAGKWVPTSVSGTLGGWRTGLSATKNTKTGNSSLTYHPLSLPKGAMDGTGTAEAQMNTKTLVPTNNTQHRSVMGSFTATIVDSQGTVVTVVVGPSGYSRTPLNDTTNATVISPPSALPSDNRDPQASGHFGVSGQPVATSISGQRIVTGTVGSQTITEIFVPTRNPTRASLNSTTTSNITDAQSTEETLVVVPGGLARGSLSQAPSGVPQSHPPTRPPGDTYTASLNQPGSSPTITSAPNTKQSSSLTASGAAQSSAIGAFDQRNQSETVIIVGGATLHFSKETITSLSTITAPTTITTPMVETNKGGSIFTISAAVIIVGPGGIWWNGGIPGFALHGPSCIWPFCPPGGGGDIGGSGSGHDPTDPNTSGNSEEPSDPDNENSSKSQELQSKLTPSTTATSATTSSSSTSSSSSSSSAFFLGCAMGCPTCDGNPTQSRLKMPKRRLSHPTLKPPRKSLDKRTLETPADYQGDVIKFLVSQFKGGYWLNINRGAVPGAGVSTGVVKVFENVKFNVGVGGLQGCTSVFVISQQGLWWSHFWEIPAFRAENYFSTPPPARTDRDAANFQTQVIDQMQFGTAYIDGLNLYTAPGGLFDPQYKPEWVIITPRADFQGEGLYRYEPEVWQIKNVLTDLFPTAGLLIVGYAPKFAEYGDRVNPTTGIALLQYDPFEREVPVDENNECNVWPQTMVRLWVEDGDSCVMQKEWFASVSQLDSHNIPSKRDIGAACPAPSSLIQASTELSDADILLSGTADPYSTHWVTPSPAPATPSLTCMADGGPGFSPTSWCNCGDGSIYPTLSPANGAATASCAYTTVPTAMITPVLTSTAIPDNPGEGGVPGCVAVIFTDPHANYCDCGGTPAPFLTIDVSGTATSNCDYTVQPTAGSFPAPSYTPPLLDNFQVDSNIYPFQPSTPITTPPPPKTSASLDNLQVDSNIYASQPSPDFDKPQPPNPSPDFHNNPASSDNLQVVTNIFARMMTETPNSTTATITSAPAGSFARFWRPSQ